METSIRKASSITTISKSMKTSISMSSIRISSIGIRISSSSNNWGSGKRSWCWDLMDRGSSLQGSKTSSGSSNLVNISKICSSNLSSLGISIYWSKSSMLSSFSSSKSSIEHSLGSSNISCVLNWEGSGKSQKGSNDQFIHVCACSRESSE